MASSLLPVSMRCSTCYLDSQAGSAFFMLSEGMQSLIDQNNRKSPFSADSERQCGVSFAALVDRSDAQTAPAGLVSKLHLRLRFITKAEINIREY